MTSLDIRTTKLCQNQFTHLRALEIYVNIKETIEIINGNNTSNK